MKLKSLFENKLTDMTWRQFIKQYTDRQGNVNGSLYWHDDYQGDFRIGKVAIAEDYEDEEDETEVVFGDISFYHEGKWQSGDWEIPTDAYNESYNEQLDDTIHRLYTFEQR